MAENPNYPPYDPNFLGPQVTLPTATSIGADGSDGKGFFHLVPEVHTNLHWLHHCHFDTLFNKERRIAIFSAANVDLSQEKVVQGRNFTYDPLLAAEFQYGNDWYSKDHWDRGHLTLRDTIGWGVDEQEAKRATSQVDFWTNIAPQHENFHHGIWTNDVEAGFKRAIEIAAGRRVVEITGSLFLEVGKDEKIGPNYHIPPIREDTSASSSDTRLVPNAFYKGVYWVHEEGESKTLKCCFWIAYQDSEDGRNNRFRYSSPQEIFGLLGFAASLEGSQWLTAEMQDV